MKTFNLALVQHASPVGKRDANFDATVDWVKKAARKGADLICLPELGITGHAGHASMVHEAEPVPNGPSVNGLAVLAEELGIYICAGIAEDDRGIHYNTQFVVGPDGYWGKQRKIHLSGDEYFFFKGGSAMLVFDLPFVRLGIVICYDNNLPEPSRCLAVKGAELILAPHAARFGNWPASPAKRAQSVKGMKAGWTQVHSCRALDNGTYVGVCNTAGRSAIGIKGVEANHAGGCMVFNPMGAVIAESKGRDIKDEMIVVELDSGPVTEARKRKCFNLQTRRPEVFGALTEISD
jgi:predicted amidohydrolase